MPTTLARRHWLRLGLFDARASVGGLRKLGCFSDHVSRGNDHVVDLQAQVNSNKCLRNRIKLKLKLRKEEQDFVYGLVLSPSGNSSCRAIQYRVVRAFFVGAYGRDHHVRPLDGIGHVQHDAISLRRSLSFDSLPVDRLLHGLILIFP